MRNVLFIGACVLIVFGGAVFAQETSGISSSENKAQSTSSSVVAANVPQSSNSEQGARATSAFSAQLAITQPAIDVDKMPSLFFSTWQHDLITSARSGLNVRPPGIDDGTEGSIGDAPREIALAGIVYTSKSDWTIWLNNMRVSPGRLPSEVMDLKVYKDHVDLEWFDSTTNQIFPIRLRAHQRFNLDSRIFLPGA